MSRAFVVPELGESVKSATVAKILVSKGDKVSLEQAVAELETDKVSLEVPSNVEGIVDEVLVREGDEVKVSQPLFTVSSPIP